MGFSLKKAWNNGIVVPFKKAFSRGLDAKSLPVFTGFAWVGGLPVFNNGDAISNINEGYCGSEDVYSIVKRISTHSAMLMDTFKVNKIVDEEAFEKFMAFEKLRDYSVKGRAKSAFLKSKALEEVQGPNDLQRLLDNPNPSYIKSEYNSGLSIMRLITGNTYIHAPSLEFGVNKGRPAELWIMPSQFTSLQVSDTWPRRILGYKLIMGVIQDVPAQDVIQVRYFNPQYTYVGNELIGLSPLRAGSKVLDKNESETQYSVNAFQNAGISGIVYNESISGDEVAPDVLGKLKSDFYNEGSGTANARKLLFQAGKIGYQAVGLGPVDMDVLASMKLTFKKLCNLFGVSDRLFNNDATGSEVSDDNTRKDFYINAVLPEVCAFRDAYNTYLVPKFNDDKNKYFIDFDISNIIELQDNFKDMASIYGQLPFTNLGVVAKAFNIDVDQSDPILKQWFIKNGYTTIEDAMAGPVDPLPIDTQNGN